MIQIPYIRIVQREETFYLTKFKARFLLNHINFHYREPYSDLLTDKIILKDTSYINAITQKGIDLQSNEEGVQRRLQIERINSIKRFIEDDFQNFLPNTVILSADISSYPELEEKYISYEDSEVGTMEFPTDFLFSIIDGQHRLAGLSQVRPKLQDEFEIPAVILFNVSKPVAAKLFADINGKQKSVNKSLIYDLYAEMDRDDYGDIKKFHIVCENLYRSEKSPLYRQIKMLGIGNGAISQAFFIDYAKNAINKTPLEKQQAQPIFDHLFYYFRAYQKTFPEDWPVPEQTYSHEYLDVYANQVLKVRNSQLVKTNGFGAILRAFPTIYKLARGENSEYLALVEHQKDRISWIKPPSVGTGTGYQKSLLDQILECYKDLNIPSLFGDLVPDDKGQ